MRVNDFDRRVREQVEWAFGGHVGRPERPACRRCGRPLGLAVYDDPWRASPALTRWRHLDPRREPAFIGLVLLGSVGCRSASFDYGEDWDDTLPRTWRAQPLGASA